MSIAELLFPVFLRFSLPENAIFGESAQNTEDKAVTARQLINLATENRDKISGLGRRQRQH